MWVGLQSDIQDDEAMALVGLKPPTYGKPLDPRLSRTSI
jgi:hypothetical protein